MNRNQASLWRQSLRFGGCSSHQRSPHRRRSRSRSPPPPVPNTWVCDIEEKEGETNCDFLFVAEIGSDGTVEATDNTGVCIFGNVMYDINKFTPDLQFDGELNFTIAFGKSTVERLDAPSGWKIEFNTLVPSTSDTVRRPRYTGTVKTTWWGVRKVTLILYESLTRAERARFPDLNAIHFRSVDMPRPGMRKSSHYSGSKRI
jgi:hypothetical protein